MPRRRWPRSIVDAGGERRGRRPRCRRRRPTIRLNWSQRSWCARAARTSWPRRSAKTEDVRRRRQARPARDVPRRPQRRGAGRCREPVRRPRRRPAPADPARDRRTRRRGAGQGRRGPRRARLPPRRPRLHEVPRHRQGRRQHRPRPRPRRRRLADGLHRHVDPRPERLHQGGIPHQGHRHQFRPGHHRHRRRAQQEPGRPQGRDRQARRTWPPPTSTRSRTASR